VPGAMGPERRHFHGTGRKLNLGCGKDIRPRAEGWVNLDVAPLPGVDVVHDLLDLPWPFPDQHFDAVYASHVIEHIPPRLEDSPRDPFFRVMEEVWRVLRFGGVAHLETPHPAEPLRHRDPTHYRVFHPRSMEYFHPDDANHYYTTATFEQLRVDRVYSPRWPLSQVYVGGKGVFFWLCEKPVVRVLVGRGSSLGFTLRKVPGSALAAPDPVAGPAPSGAVVRPTAGP
jgi:predicted SAM-dependent methyltransferase